MRENTSYSLNEQTISEEIEYNRIRKISRNIFAGLSAVAVLYFGAEGYEEIAADNTDISLAVGYLGAAVLSAFYGSVLRMSANRHGDTADRLEEQIQN